MKRQWTVDEINKLKSMAQREPVADIAAALGRSVGATCVKAHQLKVSLKVPKGSMWRLPSDDVAPLG